ncbi:MAG: ribbon-helix-helix protein, CopG family [Steroidobacteraceae bacterium]
MSRANPFADVGNLPTFEPKPKASTPVPKEQIEKVAEANGFPSRQPTKSPARKRVGRRYKTGRNQQINIKATPEVIERLYKLADARHVPLGELLEEAVATLEKSAE